MQFKWADEDFPELGMKPQPKAIPASVWKAPTDVIPIPSVESPQPGPDSDNSSDEGFERREGDAPRRERPARDNPRLNLRHGFLRQITTIQKDRADYEEQWRAENAAREEAKRKAAPPLVDPEDDKDFTEWTLARAAPSPTEPVSSSPSAERRQRKEQRPAQGIYRPPRRTVDSPSEPVESVPHGRLKSSQSPAVPSPLVESKSPTLTASQPPSSPSLTPIVRKEVRERPVYVAPKRTSMVPDASPRTDSPSDGGRRSQQQQQQRTPKETTTKPATPKEATHKPEPPTVRKSEPKKAERPVYVPPSMRRKETESLGKPSE